MFIKLHTSTLDIDINTESKYSVIIGESGVGKSHMLDVLNLLLRDNIQKVVEASHSYSILNTTELVPLMAEHPQLLSTNIYFIDEYLALKYSDVLKNAEAYFIIISRDNRVRINCGYKDIYLAVQQKEFTTIKRAYPDFKLPDKEFTFDVCITEDSGHGAKFFSKWLETQIVYGDGKDTFSRHLSKIPHEYSILLVFDGGGIGSHIRKVLQRINTAKGYTAVYCCVPECFEQLLLYSSIVDYKDHLSLSTVGNDTTEQFCEKQLETLSQNKPWQYSHKGRILSDCWLIECVDCVNKCVKATKNKLEAILSTGPCKDLLQGKCSQKVQTVSVPSQYTVPEYYAVLTIRKYSHSVALFTSAHNCYECLVNETVFKCSYNSGYAIFYTFVIKTTKGLIVYSIPIKIGNKQYTNEKSFDYLYNIEEVQI